MDSPSPRSFRLPDWWPPRRFWTVVWVLLFVVLFVATLGGWLLYAADHPIDVGTTYGTLSEMLTPLKRLTAATVIVAFVLAIHEHRGKNPDERRRWTQLWTVAFGLLFLISVLAWLTIGVRFALEKAKDGTPASPEFVHVTIGLSAATVFLMLVVRLRERGDDKAFRAIHAGRHQRQT